MTRSKLIGLMSVFILWGLSASAALPKKYLSFSNPVVYFEAGHDVCGGKAWLESRGAYAVLHTDFTKCNYLQLKLFADVKYPLDIRSEYLLDFNQTYQGKFSPSTAMISGDTLVVDTHVVASEPPPPPRNEPPPPPRPPTYKYQSKFSYKEIYTYQPEQLLSQCGGSAMVTWEYGYRVLHLQNIGQCQIVTAYDPYTGASLGTFELEGPPYHYSKDLRWTRPGDVFFSITTRNGARGADVLVHP